MASKELIDFSLYDENFKLYTARVTPAEAAVLRIDGNKCFQKIQLLKEREKDQASCVPLCQPTPKSTKTKKASKPRKFDNFSTDKLLLECVKYRKWLRPRIPPYWVWEKLTTNVNDVLAPHAQFEGHYKYTCTDIKEKVRALKSTFRECKKGQHGGEAWPFYYLMQYTYDEAIEDGDTTLAPKGLDFHSLSIAAGDFEVHGSELVPLASSSMLRPSSSSESNENQGEVNNNEAGTSQHNAEDFDDLGVNHLDDFQNVDDQTEKDDRIEDNMSQVHYEENFDTGRVAQIPDSPERSHDFSHVNEEAFDVDSNEHVTQQAVSNIIEDVRLQYAHQRKSIPVRGPRLTVSASPAKASPAKKKMKRVTGVSVNANILRSPAKNSPRKRKVPKSSLNWDSNMTSIFISECENFKGEVQGSTTIQPATWKSISNAMKTNHDIEVGWDICRDKFLQMKDFFMETLLPLEGIMAGTKWPYYDKFCSLYDIPQEYHSIIISREGNGNLEDEEEEDNADDEGDPNIGSKLWPKTIVELYLDLFKVKKDAFESTKSFLKHALLYSELALEINDFTGRNYTTKQCQDKMGRLNEKFRKEFDACNRTGSKPSSWPHYDRMLKMYDGSPTLIPPYIASAGTGLVYKVKGQEKVSSSYELGARSRPKAEYQPKEKKQPKGKKCDKSVRNWQQDLQERKLANQVALHEEIRMLRLGLEEGRKDRKQILEQLLNKK